MCDGEKPSLVSKVKVSIFVLTIVKKVKIGILGTRGIPNRYGGFEELAEKLSVLLALKGHEVWVYAPSFTSSGNKQHSGAIVVSIRIPAWLPSSLQTLIYDLRCLRHANRQQLNVVLECGYSFSPFLYLFRQKFRNRVVTNMDGMEWQRAKWGWLARRFLRFAESIAVKQSAEIIADHPVVQEYYQNRYGVSANYISYGADFDQPNAPQALYPPSARGYLLVVSRPEPDNSLNEILHAFKLSSCPLKLMVVGRFTNSYGRKMAKQYSSDKILFLGGIYDKPLLISMLEGSLLYLHGHKVGGTNPMLLEAMANGCRIVAHNNAYNRSILENRAAFFSSESDLVHIFNRSFEYARALAEKGPENILIIGTHYQWNDVVNRYEELFQKLVERNEEKAADCKK